MTLPPLAPADFAAVFHAVHGVLPFPWQQRLAERLAAGGGWPDALDLPTASGKTAALDIALFHLALQADDGEHRTAPLRIVFVVDRRIIVDAAADRADRLARALTLASGDDALGRMAARLRHMACTDGPPLIARRLRGGLPREEDWARTPNQPTILCSTVDQVGSRLLFRGYGISDSMKPVHAGLLGSDALLLLDEAHLAAPFAQTLLRIAAYRAPPWCEALAGPWRFVSLSATPGRTVADFALDAEDHADPVLQRRLQAAKPAVLRVLETAADTAARAAQFAEVAVAQIGTPALHRIAVVVNRVALARAVFEHVRAAAGDQATVLLLTGRIRGHDRDALLTQHGPSLLLGAPQTGDKVIVVATQTIEAGADFDFDALITQAAPLDALRQRFGRLNRAGRDFAAPAFVLAAKNETGARADDAVYGDRTTKTWAWLTKQAGKPAKGREPSVDFGIAALGRLLAVEPDAAAALSTEKPEAPILRPADVMLLSWTAPVPAVDPAVSLFLHGPQSAPADVSIVWRADVEEDHLDDAEAWLALAPPHSGETLQVPVWAARAWLAGQREAGAAIADLEGVRAPEEMSHPARSRRVLRWAGEGQDATGSVTAATLRPGDVIVVPASYGGCDGFGWNPSSVTPVEDLGDLRSAGQRAVHRLHPSLLREDWALIAALISEGDDRDDADRLRALAAAGMIEEPRSWRLYRPKSYAGVVLVGPRQPGLIAATEDDESSTSSPRAVSLCDHVAAVEATARAFARAAGLAPSRIGDIALAARWHDAGKADPRFQALLHGGDRLLAALTATQPLAKSAMPPDPEMARRARTAAGLPERWRHEAQSVTRAIAAGMEAESADPDLVLWLIGTHHGHGRPLFPHEDPRETPDAPGPQRIDFQFAGRDWPQLFELLKERYGPWELARMEAVLRLADHRTSEATGQ
jgi:CRISPR-associated endonuclease/helicase Cas3